MDTEKIITNLGENAHYCDIRTEHWERTAITLKDGLLEKVTHGEEEGAMVRVLYENGWGYTGTSNLENLNQAAQRALSMAKSNNKFKKEKTGLSDIEIYQEEVKIPMKEDITDVGPEEKIAFLEEINEILSKNFVTSIELRYEDSLVKKEILSSEGTHIRMEIPRVLVYLIITGKSDAIQRAREGIGGTKGYELTKEAYKRTGVVLERLEALLRAKTPPSGVMPLIMDSHLTGVFVHEAFGHAAEGDTVTSGSSCLEGKLGEKVATDTVTIKDDPTLDGYGSFPFDDEGTKARPRILVRNGVLNNYILDRESAYKLGLESNGGARAEDFRVKPLVRMSNTIMEPGTMTFEELLEGMDKGVYAQSSSGGEVSPAQGTFQFNAQVAYLIENGEITTPLRDVSFSGFTLDTLQNITGVTKDFYMGMGHCGKGQRAQVSDGGPHVLVSKVTVGGRA
ncbi:MAG: TldD/PmbA family protein [Theionarchaea archaeon]|nr:TldD/PmbA family protein [Theionarchaea archaeon]